MLDVNSPIQTLKQTTIIKTVKIVFPILKFGVDSCPFFSLVFKNNGTNDKTNAQWLEKSHDMRPIK